MCTKQQYVKSLSPYGQKVAFVPCGRCEECRDLQKYQWQFRLRCELDFCRRQKWQLAFFTLTYNDENLPHIPDAFYKDETQIPDEPVQCFSRRHVRTFIDNIRKRLNELYGTKSLRYMVCSELGDHTQRSHYHGIISFPPECDPKKVFSLVHSQWKYGFVFPRCFNGGYDFHGYKHQPFIISGSTHGAAVYAAKYVCKDLNFYKSLRGCELVDRDDPLFKLARDCLPFHIQSRSIGKSYLSNLSDSDLLRLLREGESFVGVSKRIHLPLYIRNKILYTPKYSYVERTLPDEPSADWWYDFEADKWCYKKSRGTHYRQVSKEPTKFLLDNYEQIFAQKREYYRQFFKDISSADYWTNRGGSRVGASRIVNTLSEIKNLEHFVDYFVSYYGVPPSMWFSSVPSRQWLLRYLPSADLPKHRGSGNFIFVGCKDYDRIIDTVCNQLTYVTAVDKEKRKRISFIQDIYKHST